MGLFVTFAMKPTIEKMTTPANMLVKELIQHTMTESLQRGDKGREAAIVIPPISPLSPCPTFGSGGLGGVAELSQGSHFLFFGRNCGPVDLY